MVDRRRPSLTNGSHPPKAAEPRRPKSGTKSSASGSANKSTKKR